MHSFVSNKKKFSFRRAAVSKEGNDQENENVLCVLFYTAYLLYYYEHGGVDLM